MVKTEDFLTHEYLKINWINYDGNLHSGESSSVNSIRSGCEHPTRVKACPVWRNIERSELSQCVGYNHPAHGRTEKKWFVMKTKGIGSASYYDWRTVLQNHSKCLSCELGLHWQTINSIFFVISVDIRTPWKLALGLKSSSIPERIEWKGFTFWTKLVEKHWTLEKREVSQFIPPKMLLTTLGF